MKNSRIHTKETETLSLYLPLLLYNLFVAPMLFSCAKETESEREREIWRTNNKIIAVRRVKKRWNKR